MFIQILTYFLMFVEALCCLLLIGVILLQRSKGQGMGGLAFGGAMGESLFGAQMGNVLTKTTVILAIVFLVNTAILTVLGASRHERSVVDTIPSTSAVPMQPEAPMGQPMGPIDSMPEPVEIPAAQGPVSIPEPISIPAQE